jgi:hypothetical protein
MTAIHATIPAHPVDAVDALAAHDTYVYEANLIKTITQRLAEDVIAEVAPENCEDEYTGPRANASALARAIGQEIVNDVIVDAALVGGRMLDRWDDIQIIGDADTLRVPTVIPADLVASAVAHYARAFLAATSLGDLAEDYASLIWPDA